MAAVAVAGTKLIVQFDGIGVAVGVLVGTEPTSITATSLHLATPPINPCADTVVDPLD
jgi:hypothetical protein